MAYYHVLLNGSGTSGDGSTWNDDSSGTAAFIGPAGFDSACDGAAAGDIIYVKGSGSSGSSVTPTTTTSLALTRNPVRIYGVKAATTNLGASIVQSDLIPGIATGDSTRAYAQTAGNAPPSLTVTGISDILFDGNFYVYGMLFTSSDNLYASSGTNNTVVFEECHFTVDGVTDIVGTNTQSNTLLKQCKITTTGGDLVTNGTVEFFDCEYIGSSTAIVAGTSSGIIMANCCDFSGSSVAGVLEGASGGAFVKAMNCQMPTSYTAIEGTDTYGTHVFENWGSDTTTGLTTGNSEQQYDYHDAAGDVVIETTAVRTGGADDGSAGGFSYDMTTAAGGTVVGQLGLRSPWMNIWITGDGTSQNVDVYFTSDNGNTQAADWTDDEVWLEICYPSESGASKYDTKSTRMTLLGSPGALNDDTGSTWGGVTKNDQYARVSIAPDYDGYARVRLVFAPGANAETIYVDPLPVVS